MHRITRLTPLVCALVVLLAAARPSRAWTLDVRETTLSNGMRVLVVERHRVPVVTCQVWVAAGSAYETMGSTGLAHFHEHLMFKGTPHIGTRDYAAEVPLMEREDQVAEELRREQDKGDAPDQDRTASLREDLRRLESEQAKLAVPSEYDSIYTQAGAADTNAGTWKDTTDYEIELPSNKLELLMWMESDRFLQPTFREFYSERDVIAEERKQSVEDQPSGRYEELLNQVTYPESSYGFDVGGAMWDIGRLSRPDAYAFFHTFYIPNNMCVILVGDVSADEVFALAERYFGRIPRGADPPPIRSRQRLHVGERRIRVVAEAEPQVDIRCVTTAFDAPDHVALDVVAGILSGDGGRLQKDLVDTRKMALSVSAGTEDGKVIGTLDVSAVPAPGTEHDALEDALWEHLERVGTEPATEAELDRVRRQVRAGVYSQARDDFPLASLLGTYWAYTGRWEGLASYVDRVAAVTAEDVMRVAAAYLTPDNAAVGWLVPEEHPADAGPGEGGGQ